MRKLNVLGIALLMLLVSSLMAFKSINTSFSMPAISLQDTAGHTVNLNSLKGKLIYYDFWASWCMPCMREITPTRDLQNSIDSKEITWVFISYDKDINTWKKSVKESNLSGIHLWANPENIKVLKEQLSIYSIPFCIWADHENKIIKYDAPKPSQGIKEKLVKALEKQDLQKELSSSISN